MSKEIYEDENPKEGASRLKHSFEYLPAAFEAELAVAMSEGRKYGRHNYREATGIRASVYYNAIRRHLMAWWEGEDVDPDSGVHHLVKVAACCAVARDSMLAGAFVDDRPPELMPGWREALQQAYEEIVERHPEEKPAFTRTYAPKKETRPCT